MQSMHCPLYSTGNTVLAHGGAENAGHEIAGHENAKQKTSIFIAVILINCNLANTFST